MTTIEQATIDNTIIRASAGSGKTTALASRYLQLLLRGVQCHAILATTFTRKAAGEILDRIMTGLASSSLDDSEAKKVGETLKLAGFDQKTARLMLRHLLNNLHRLQVGTLDSFFAKLARSFSLEMGLDPDWEIVEQRAIDQLAQASVSSVLSHSDAIQLLHLMAKGDSIRGANKLMMDTVGQLYEIFLDSTPGAWFQLQSHAALSPNKLVSALEQLTTIGIADKRMATARVKDCERAANEDWDGFIANGLAAKILDQTNEYFKKPIPDELRSAYLPLIDHVRGLVTNELKDSTESTYNLLERFRERFEPSKTESGSLGFNDVTRRLVELLNSSGDQAEANWTHRLDGNLDHLLLDEFQDTSPAQWRVIEPFARRVMKPETKRSFFCVGDMKQAIFGWRGGVAEVFDLVINQLPGLREDKLTHSYRSSQLIIDTVNQVFEHADRYESSNPFTNAVVQRWKDRFTTHTTEKTALPGYAVLERIDEADDLFEVAAKRIKAIYEGSPNGTIAVLTRANTEVKELIFALHSAGVPASEEGGNPLTDSAAVLLILSLMQLGDHPSDSVAWFHVANSPLAAMIGLPPCEIKWEKSSAILRQVHSVAADVRRELSENGYGATVARWAAVLAPLCTVRELRRLQKLIELSDEYDAQATLRPADFVEFVQAQKVEDPTGSPVRVMTIHKAKGLEFDVVVLPCLAKTFTPRPGEAMFLRQSPTEPISFVARYVNSAHRQLLPPAIQEAYEQQFERGLNEAICVLYVAMTRAIHALYMFVDAKELESYQSMSGVLLATLSNPNSSPVKSAGIVYEHGDPDWATKLPVSAVSPAAKTSPKRTAARRDFESKKLTLAEPTLGPSRGLAIKSPSQMASSNRGTIGLALAQSQDSGAQDRGTILHACFAQIQWLDEASWQTGLRDELRRRFPDYAKLESLVDEFLQMVRQPTIQSLLHRASYSDQIARRACPNQIIFEPLTASVENERSFAVRMDRCIVQGTVDRLVLIHQGSMLLAAEVVEYKSDRLGKAEESAIQQRVADYRPQIEAYRRAVAQFTGLAIDQVLARLMLVGIDREFEVR